MKLKVGVVILCVVAVVVQCFIVLGQFITVKYKLEFESDIAIATAYGFIETSILLVLINLIVISILIILLFRKAKPKKM